MTHTSAWTYDADHPAVLIGQDHGPTPVEFLLHALAACLASGLANIAAARVGRPRRGQTTVEGDIDLLGILGLSDEVRNGFEQIAVRFADARRRSRQAPSCRGAVAPRSAVYDVLTNGVPVSIEVDAG